MKQQPDQRQRHVSFDFFRQRGPQDPCGFSSFLVTVSDDALLALNRDHPARHLIIRFNGCGSPAYRLRALSEALSEFETKNMVRPAKESSALMGMLGRALRAGVASAFVLGALFGAGLVGVIVLLNR